MSNDVGEYSVHSSESRRYIVGPMLELRLPWRLGIEFDALYRRFGYTSSLSFAGIAWAIIRERSDSWEFPLIVKYRLPLRQTRPFAGIGYDSRTVRGSTVSSGGSLSGPTTWTYHFDRSTTTDYPVTHGLVMSGGLELEHGHFRVSPELRYVHWNRPFLNQYGGSGSYRIQSIQDEFFVLLGFSWH